MLIVPLTFGVILKSIDCVTSVTDTKDERHVSSLFFFPHRYKPFLLSIESRLQQIRDLK